MPRKTKTAANTGKSALPQLSKQMIEEPIPGPVTKEQFTDIFDHFRKAFIKRVMQAEMSHHLGCGVGEAKPEGVTNQRNGSSSKTIISDSGAIYAPRCRASVRAVLSRS